MTKKLEVLVQGLSILSFMLMCWVVHRSLQVRTHCVNSSFIGFVQVGSQRVGNCIFESRLNLQSLLHPLPADTSNAVRALEVIEPLAGLFPNITPRLAVEINRDQPYMFELGHSYLRLGENWLDDRLQTQRALIMAVLNQEQPDSYTTNFQLETVADFLLMAVLNERQWSEHSVADDIKFPTSAPSFRAYCKSPFRSLAHYEACTLPDPDSVDMQAEIWGFRPLLAAALWRVFDKAPLMQKLNTLRAIGQGVPLPTLDPVEGKTAGSLVEWFDGTLREQLHALSFKDDDKTDFLIRRTLKELEVEAPTKWELTVDITHTPVWKDILQQFKTRSLYRRFERTLVFTPEGAVAFPSGLPVGWASSDIQSQTHVMIACQWPKPGRGSEVNVVFRHLFARHSCAKVDEVFWN